MSATFFGQRDQLPSQEQHWSDEDDDLEVPTPAPQVQLTFTSIDSAIQPERIFVSFFKLPSEPSESLLKQIGQVSGDQLQGQVYSLTKAGQKENLDIWVRLNELHRLRRRAQVEQLVHAFAERLNTQFPRSRWWLLGLQDNFDDPLRCYSSDGQLHPTLKTFEQMPPVVLCKAWEAALFGWRVSRKLSIDYVKLPLLDELPEQIQNANILLPKALRQCLWSDRGSRYMKATSNLYA